MPNLPLIPARRTFRGVTFHCPYCRCDHIHGGYGAKQAHCTKPSPYRDTGYRLVPEFTKKESNHHEHTTHP